MNFYNIFRIVPGYLPQFQQKVGIFNIQSTILSSLPLGTGGHTKMDEFSDKFQEEGGSFSIKNRAF